MTTMKLSELLYHLYDTPIYSDVMVTGLSLDSRTIKPGDLFFACARSLNKDVDLFIAEAIEKGAVAILQEVDKKSISVHKKGNVSVFPVHHLDKKVGAMAAQFFGYPSEKLKITGITGTNGKTSISHFIAQALQQQELKCGVVGTLGNGLYGQIKPGPFTTPDAITLQTYLADFLKQHIRYVAMEVSSHGIDQGRINGTKFEVGVFTNLTRDHLDYHGSMEAYGKAKAQFIQSELVKNAVINADDPFGLHLLKSSKNHSYAYSVQRTPEIPSSTALVFAENISYSLSGVEATIQSPWGSGTIHSKLIGSFNLSNLLATLTSLCLLKVPFEKALKSVSELKPVSGRMQTFGGNAQPLVIVDYAHTPDALEQTLKAIREHCQGRLMCLFGCGGDRDRGKRPLMAKVAEEIADIVMVTDDNPRTEDPAQIVSDIMEGFVKSKKVSVEHDRSKAIVTIIQSAQQGDCVLIAGKGAEEYQLIGEKKIPFSDIEKVREILAQ